MAVTPILACLLTFLIIPVFRILATHIGLVDKPNHRKVHLNLIPLIGGVSIFFASTLTLGLSLSNHEVLIGYKNLFLSSFILLIMGLIDDRFDLSALNKLFIQLILAHYIFMQGIQLESLHGFMGIYQLPDWIQYLLTILTITGVVNAFNLMDGIDGLVAGLSIVSFMVYSWLSFITGNDVLCIVFLTLTGSTVAFLYFNLNKRKKIFMGDAGSLMIGFILSVSGIKLLQSTTDHMQLSQVLIGVFLIFLIPVFDALRVFRMRIKSGKSPFNADRTHLHHLILSLGLQHKFVAVLITCMMILILVLGFTFYSFVGLSFSIGFMIFFFFVISYFLQLNDLITHWKKKIKVMEQGSVN